MKRATFLFALGITLAHPAQAAWWESVQPEARIWMKKVDPNYQNIGQTIPVRGSAPMFMASTGKTAC